MKLWFNAKKTAAKSLIAVICVMSLVVTGITGCGTSQPNDANTVSNATGGDEGRQENVTQQAQTNVQEEEAYKLPDFDVEEEKPIAVDVDEDWPVEYLLASMGDGGAFSGEGGYPRRDGFEVYAFAPENVRCGYDNTNGFSIKISDTGSEDWHIQLKKNGVKLENGKWYQVTFDAKSSIDRSIVFSMQRDGTKDEDWRSYSGTKTIQLGNDWKPYTIIFRMADETDNRAIYNLALGTVGGNRIKQQHTVNIKNMQLEELEDSWLDRVSQEGNLLKNPNFEYDDIAWEASVVEPGAANVKFENGKAVFDISNVGTTDWHVQLKQDSIPMEHGYNYRLTFKASSTASRSINIGFMDKNFVNWYGGSLEALNAGAERTIAVEFYMDKATDKDVCMFISMGKIDNMNTPASVITLSDFMLEKLPGRPVSSGSWSSSWSSSGWDEWKAPIVSLGRGWELSYWFGEVGKCYEDAPGSYVIEILDTGSLDWHVQMQKKGIEVKNGRTYRMSFEAKSSVVRKIGCAIQKDGTNDDDWTSYSGGSGKYELNSKWQTFTEEFSMTSATDRNAIFNISLGAVDRIIKDAHTVYIRNIKLEDITDEPIESVPIGKEMLTADKREEFNPLSGNSITEDNGIFTANITNLGANHYDEQIKWNGLTLEKGCTYKFECNASFDNGERVIKLDIMDGTYDWYDGTGFIINDTEKKYEYTFTVKEKPTINDGMLTISLGKIAGEETPPGTVTLSNISLIKTAEKADEPDNPDNPIEGENILPPLNDEKWELKLNTAEGVTGIAKVESIDEETAVISIENVGSKAHCVQFAIDLVNDLKLDEGAKYKVYCDVESDVKRPISVMVQSKETYDPYNGVYNKQLRANTKEPIEFTFEKSNGDDAVFAVNMGKADNGADTPNGTVTLSNIKIVKIEDAPNPDDSGLKLIADGDDNILKDSIPKVDAWNGSVVKENKTKTKVEINALGDNPWDIQFKCTNFKLISGSTYTATYNIESSVDRKITVGVQKSGGGSQYGNKDVTLTAGECKTITVDVKEDNESGAYEEPLEFFISMGNFKDNTQTGTITISNLSLVKKSGEEEPDDTDLTLIADVDGNILNGEGTYTWYTNNVTLNGTQMVINSLGSNSWDAQFTRQGFKLETGATYTATCKIKSSVDRNVSVAVQKQDGSIKYSNEPDKELTADKWETITFEVKGDSDGKYNSPIFCMNVGKFSNDNLTTPHTITICDLSLVKKSGEEEPDDTDLTLTADGEDNILKGYTAWTSDNVTYPGTGTKIEVSARNGDDSLWSAMFGIDGFTLENSNTYIATCRIKSSVARNVEVRVEKAGSNGQTVYSNKSIVLPENQWVEISMKVDENGAGYESPLFSVYLGNYDNNLGQHTITICDILLVKESETSTEEGISTLSSDTEIEASSLIDDADEEETDEEETDEDVADEETEDDEDIQENTDENLNADEKTPEDTPDDYVTPETVDNSPNEDGNGSDDSN